MGVERRSESGGDKNEVATHKRERVRDEQRRAERVDEVVENGWGLTSMGLFGFWVWSLPRNLVASTGGTGGLGEKTGGGLLLVGGRVVWCGIWCGR